MGSLARPVDHTKFQKITTQKMLESQNAPKKRNKTSRIFHHAPLKSIVLNTNDWFICQCLSFCPWAFFRFQPLVFGGSIFFNQFPERELDHSSRPQNHNHLYLHLQLSQNLLFRKKQAIPLKIDDLLLLSQRTMK